MATMSYNQIKFLNLVTMATTKDVYKLFLMLIKIINQTLVGRRLVFINTRIGKKFGGISTHLLKSIFVDPLTLDCIYRIIFRVSE